MKKYVWLPLGTPIIWHFLYIKTKCVLASYSTLFLVELNFWTFQYTPQNLQTLAKKIRKSFLWPARWDCLLPTGNEPFLRMAFVKAVLF